MTEQVQHVETAGSLSLRKAYEQELVEQLRRKDRFGDYISAVVAEVVRPGQEVLLHFGNPYLEQPTIITLPTRLPLDEVERIASKIIPTAEACDMLTFLAECYSMRLPALIEGPTALGKTYIIKKFNELLYGEGIAPLDFYCSGQTDVAELMAKWVPKTSSARETELWNEFLRSERGQEALKDVLENAANADGVPQCAPTLAKLQRLAEGIGLGSKTQWELQLGAVPKAMLGTHDEHGAFRCDEHHPIGCILHVEEVGLARPAVVNALLKIRGELGEVCREIALWEDGGRRIVAGPSFWFVMSTNPPEDYDAREPVDQALARGMVFRRYPEVSKASYLMVARRYFGYQMGNAPQEPPGRCILPLYRHEQLCGEIAELMAEFHASCVDQCKAGESGRSQRLPVTFDDMARVAGYILKCQVRDSSSAQLDIVETLRRGVERMYLGRLLPEERLERGVDVLQEAGARSESTNQIGLRERLKALFEHLLNGETGIKSFEQKKLKRADILRLLAGRAHAEEEKQRFGRVLNPEEEISFRKERLRHEAKEQINVVEQLMRKRGLVIESSEFPQIH